MLSEYYRDDGFYYDVEKDTLNKYPDAWCFLVVGARNRGKTYSGLKYQKTNKRKFIFIKRTNLDVNNLCAGGSVHNKRTDTDFDFDLSPFADLNDDFGWNVKANKIFDGLGGFWDYSPDDELLSRSPIGFIFSLNRVSKFKGFGGLRECTEMIFDEFIASPWERVSHEEGNQLMDLYKTVARDREMRGLEKLRLICFANSNDISNPLFNTLEVTDIVANMIAEGISETCVRGIVIQLLPDNPEFYEKESQTAIYQAMHNTTWGRMAFDNQFSRNDFSVIKKRFNLNHAHPEFIVHYNNETYYTWSKDGIYYTCTSKHKSKREYDLSSEGDRRRLYYRELLNMKDAVTEGRAYFKEYRMYDLFFHFRDFYKI